MSTPRAERNQRQSRRLKEVQLQNSKKQQKQRESEEEQKRKSVESGQGEEGETTITEDKENGVEGGGNSKREKPSLERRSGGQGVPILKSRRSLNFPRTNIRLVKSPAVKITKISSLSRRRQSEVTKLQPPAMQESDLCTSEEVGGASSAVTMESSTSVLSPSTPPLTCGTSSGDGILADVSKSSPLLRRSPRLKKIMSEAKKRTSCCRGDNGEAAKKRKSDEMKNEKSLKAVSHVHLCLPGISMLSGLC